MPECLALTMALGRTGMSCMLSPSSLHSRDAEQESRQRENRLQRKQGQCWLPSLSRPGAAHLPQLTLLSLTLEKMNNKKAALSQEVCKHDPIKPSLRRKAGTSSRTKYTPFRVGLTFRQAQTTTKYVFVALKVAPTQSWRVSMCPLVSCKCARTLLPE